MAGRTVYTVLEETAAAHPQKPALQQPVGGGKYRSWTWREYRDAVRQIAVGLRAAGVRKGETVGLQSETRAEFYLADMAVMAAGAVSAALYTSLPHADQAATLCASDARVVFVENVKALRALERAGAGRLNVRETGRVFAKKPARDNATDPQQQFGGPSKPIKHVALRYEGPSP